MTPIQERVKAWIAEQWQQDLRHDPLWVEVIERMAKHFEMDINLIAADKTNKDSAIPTVGKKTMSSF